MRLKEAMDWYDKVPTMREVIYAGYEELPYAVFCWWGVDVYIVN